MVDLDSEVKIISRIISNTKRKKRLTDIATISSDIQKLINIKGSLKEVSKIIGISSGMLNKFLSVNKLDEKIIQLVSERKIDSVSIVHSLSKFDNNYQTQIAQKIISGELNSQDIRILIPYHKNNPEISIENLIKNFIQSKDIKASVAYIEIGNEALIKDIERKFIEIIDIENFIDVSKQKGYFKLRMTKKGEQILRQKAKINKMDIKSYLIMKLNETE